jgi:hypothetical protein
VVAALKGAGFDVEPIQVVRKDDRVTHEETNADAILLVAVGVAYLAHSDFSDYVRLLRS